MLGIVLPGTPITGIIEKVLDELDNPKMGPDGVPIVKLGNGLLQTGEDTVTVKAGILHFAKPNRFWIENYQKRYVPCANDLVLGVITARLSESYKVDLGSSAMGNLNFSGFEGTTKKNRPNLGPGDLVFARVSVANKDLEPELVCLDVDNRAEGFGEVKGSTDSGNMLYKCSVHLAKRLQRYDNWLLETLGKHFAFEIIVGANGKFVLNTAKAYDNINLAHVILASEKLLNNESEGKKWLQQQIKQLAKSQ